jgi:hypothetical protein
MLSEGSFVSVVGGLDAGCGGEGEPVVDAVPYLRSEPPDIIGLDRMKISFPVFGSGCLLARLVTLLPV